RESSDARVQLGGYTDYLRSSCDGGRRSRQSGQSVPRLHQILRPRAKLGRADETDIAGRAAKCAAGGAFAAKVGDAPSVRETPHLQGRGRKATGRPRTRLGKFELGARLDDDDQGGPTRRAHQEAMAEGSIALPPRCGCTGANRRTWLIWSATELS